MGMTVQKKSRLANHMLEFSTVRYWQEQLNESGIKNAASNRTDTRLVYRTRLAAFSEWLPGRIFDMRVQAVADGRIGPRDCPQVVGQRGGTAPVSGRTGLETRKK